MRRAWLLLPWLLSACREPTQITVEITTELSCDELDTTSITAGDPLSLEAMDPVSVTTACDQNRRIGSIVAVPGDIDRPVGFEVVAASSLGEIVARRTLRYIEHESLVLPIPLRVACLDVECALDKTCVQGDCRSALLDPAQCSTELGCGEDALPPSGEGGAGGGGGAAEAWMQSFGGPADDVGADVAVGSDGSVVTTGHFQVTVDFGGGPVPSAGLTDLFVATFSTTGSHRWSLGASGPLQQLGRAVAIGPDGQVFVAGVGTGAIEFGGGPLEHAGGFDLFLAELDPSGDHVWSTSFGDQSDQAVHDVTAGAAGDFCAGGEFGGTIDFGGEDHTTLGIYDGFVACFDSAHQLSWSRALSGTANQSCRAVALDQEGNLFATGGFENDIDLGGRFPEPGVMNSDVFIAGYDADGGFLWSKVFGGIQDDSGLSIATDPDGNVYATGYFSNVIQVGDTMLTTNGGSDVFLAAYDPDGTLRYATSFGSANEDVPVALATDASGNVYLAGMFGGDIDELPLQNAGGLDVFVVSFTNVGDTAWAKRIGGGGMDLVSSLALDADRNVYLTGEFDVSLELPGGQLMSAGKSDIYLVKLLAEP